MTKLSIIIPAFNEAHKIQQDILAADRFLSSEDLSGEIIVIDDGSTDQTSAAAEETANNIQTPCIVERFEKNYGKGQAVRTGMLISQGIYTVFADSGVCVPFEQVKTGMDMHGSRKLPGCHISKPQSVYRRACSKLFHWFLIHDIKHLGNLTDTQCGFKLYRGDIARALYAQSTVNGFTFDIEIILMALSRGYTIKEFAVDWTCDPDSRLKPIHAATRVFVDLVHLKRRFNQFLKQG
ncbi:MAG: glycosyltransferase [Planctomycetota bacterium]|jgi:dolichyl-phosphate beta-glucosyltransferase